MAAAITPPAPPSPASRAPRAGAASPPRAIYGAVMLVGTVLGLGAAAAAATLAGGDSSVVLLAVLAVAAGAFPTFAPALMGRATTWGMLVVAASALRMMVTLGIALALIQTRDVPKGALLGGAVAGAGLILVIESAAAVWVLSRMQRGLSERV